MFSHQRLTELRRACDAHPTAWPDLPNTATEKFDIAFTSSAKGEPPDRYRLRATPNNTHKQRENRYVEIDHNSNVRLCLNENRSTKCQKW